MIRRLTFIIAVLAIVPFAAYRLRAQTTPRVVEITAKKFEFSPKEVTLVRGEPVTLRLTTLDREHGFLQKDLGVDETILPGKPVEVTITPETAGRFLVICDDYCGSGHGNMNMVIVVK